SRFVERFRSDSASSRSSFLSLAADFWDSVAVRLRLLPAAWPASARVCPCSTRFSDHLRNSSTPSSTLRMRSATCGFVKTTCANATPLQARHARIAPRRILVFIHSLLLPRHRDRKTLLRADQVVVVVLLQIDLDPVHLAAEFVACRAVVRRHRRAVLLADIARLVA